MHNNEGKFRQFVLITQIQERSSLRNDLEINSHMTIIISQTDRFTFLWKTTRI